MAGCRDAGSLRTSDLRPLRCIAAAALQVKTTAPKEYCVRPNSGKLVPGASIDINVMLQPPMPKEGTKSKDKFLVQTVYEKQVFDSNHPDMVTILYPPPPPFSPSHHGRT